MPIAVNTLVDHLNNDLANEYKHMLFYLHAAMRVQGLHREEVRKFLLAEAASEMTHVQQFGDLITGLGGTPSTKVNGFRGDLTHPKDILNYALEMEKEVVANFVSRKKQSQDCSDSVAGTRIELLMDDMISQSGADCDHLMQMVAGL